MSNLWADIAIWYQYSSANPNLATNYKNYFICSDAGLTIAPILLTVNLQITLQNCYKTIIQSLLDWSNWTEIGFNSPYWGLLDNCATSVPQQITLFTLNPVSTAYTLLGWGNSAWGNPQTDWMGDAITVAPGLKNQYQFDYCIHVLGNPNFYDLNNGGPAGDTWCMANSATTWVPSAISTYATPAAPIYTNTATPLASYQSTSSALIC